MNYNYTKLYSLLNLQQKEIKDVLMEAQKAMETLEFNRHLLERHFQITLRLQGIVARLQAMNSRMEEIQETQRLFTSDIEASNPSQPVAAKGLILPAGASLSFVPEDTNIAPSREGIQPQQAGLISQLQFTQLETIELKNQQLNLKAQKQHFEAELSLIEQQLSARGIGADQG